MKLKSIFSKKNNFKMIHRKIDEYIKLSNEEKIKYIANCVTYLNNCYKTHIEYLEKEFKKQEILVKDLYEIDGELCQWLETTYGILSVYFTYEYSGGEVYFFGVDRDEFFDDLRNPENCNDVISKDKLINYLKNAKEYLFIPPLDLRTLKIIQIKPENVLTHLTENTTSKKNITANSDNANVVYVNGNKIEVPYPFYEIAKYLENKNANDENHAIDQKTIYLDLKLTYATHRIKQWKKVKGKINPIVNTLFQINSRGYVWLKPSIAII